MNNKVNNPILAIAFSAIICIASLLSLNLLAEATEAERTVIDSGKSGDVTWTIYDDGELCVEGNGQLSYPNRTTDILDKVEKLTIGKGITSLSYMGIPEFKNLKSIQIEEGNTEFFLDDFGVLFSSDNMLLKFPAASEISEYIIPDFAISVYSDAFINAENLTTISGGNNVVIMGSDVFNSCIKLKDVTIPSKLTEISSRMFKNCTSLESITIPSSVTSIDSSAFYNCTSLASVTFGENSQLTSIGSSAFSRCTNLSSITIPDSVTSIGNYAFEDCTSLSTVIFKENSQLTHIAAVAFKNTAYSNDPANWDNGFLYLGNYLIAVNGNDISENCKLYSKTVLVADGVFKDIEKLTSVYIPNGTKHIGNSCFFGCSNLISVRLPVDLIEIGSHTFYDCTSLKEIEIPSGVKTLSWGIFNGCSSLEKVTLHDGLEAIESCSFEGTTSLKEIYIPKTVTSIVYSPFGLSGVTDIYFGGSKADWKRATKNNSLGSMTVHYTLESDDKSVMIVHTDTDFDYEAGNVHLEIKKLDKITSKYAQNEFYSKLLENPIQILDIKLVDNDNNSIQPLEEHKITIKIKATEEFMNLMKSELSTVGEYDVDANRIDFKDDNFIFEENDNTIIVSAPQEFLDSFKIVHWVSDATNINDCERFTHDKITVENGYIIFETDHFSEYAVCTELIEFESKEATLEVGQATKLNVIASENTKLSFKSSDNKVVTVDTSGNVTAVGSGTATVTVTIDGTTISDACTVTVPARKFTVKWIVDGVETSETVYENAAIVKPEAPKKDGYTFAGWSPAVPEKMPSKNIEFVAVWQKNKYTLTFNSDGKTVSSSEIGYGEDISAPKPPIKDGYTFAGWSPAVPKKMPAYSMIFTAVYEKAAVTSIEIISAPDKTNYTYKTDKLDLSGIVIKAVYSDGTNEIISDVNRINVHGFTLNSIGSKDIVIEYGGCTAKLQITVSYSWWQQIIRFLLLGFIWY